MGDRIKELRKILRLTQREFGEKIGVKPSTIATYELGRSTPLDAIISLIVREFNVNETWLREGTGEMFTKTADTVANKLAQEYGLDEFMQSVVSEYMKLSPEYRKIVRNFVHSIASETEAIPEPAAEPEPEYIPTGSDPEIEREVALFREERIREKRLESEALSVKERGAG